MMVPVLMPTAYSRTEYVVLRSLVRQGIPVHLADSGRLGMGQASRFGNSFHLRPPASSGVARVVGALKALAAVTAAGVVFPTDELTIALADYRDRLGPDVHVPVTGPEMMRLANDKRRVAKHARALGLCVPDTFEYHDPSELEGGISGSVRLVVKLTDGQGGRGVFYVNGGAAAAAQCAELIGAYRLGPDLYPLVQEFVGAEGWGVSCLYWHGRKVAGFTHRRLREKAPAGGTSTLRASARAPLLENAADVLLTSLQWHGLAMVEFKYDPDNQRYWILEINPRVWGSVALPVHCGVDFPYWLYLCAVGQEHRAHALAAAAAPYPEGRICRWVLGDAVQLLRAVAHGQFREAWNVGFGARADYWDDLSWDDPAAFLAECGYYLRQLATAGAQ